MKRFFKKTTGTKTKTVYARFQPEGFREVTDESELNELYIKLNKERKDIGKRYALDFKVKVYGKRYKDGLINEKNVSYLYHRLWQLLFRLEDGNFDSAIYLLKTELNTITADDIDNGYTDAIRDKLLTEITNLNKEI